MVNFGKVAIPIVIVLVIGGTISFLLAYSFYPEKHVNVKVNGQCYELLDNAYEKYKKLQAEKEILVLKLQANSIESPSAAIPVIFSGTQGEVDNFASRYNMKILSSQAVGTNNNYIDRYIVKAIITKHDFERLIENLTINDLDPSKKTIAGSIGLQPNSFISKQESEQISLYSKDFMLNGIQQIIDRAGEKNGIKNAECRAQIQS
jgi:hypothetical protein